MVSFAVVALIEVVVVVLVVVVGGLSNSAVLIVAVVFGNRIVDFLAVWEYEEDESVLIELSVILVKFFFSFASVLSKEVTGGVKIGSCLCFFTFLTTSPYPSSSSIRWIRPSSLCFRLAVLI